MRKYTGISITDEFIRIAEAEIESGNIKSLRLEEIPYEKSDLKDAKFIKKIRSIVKKRRLYNKAFIALNNSEVIIKDKIVPPVKKNEIFKLIEAEIKDYAIFNHQNVSLGFNVIEKAKDKIKIIWAGTKEETLLSTIKTFRKAGIKSAGIIPSNFALGKFVGTFYENKAPLVIINVDNTKTTLTFMENEKVLYTYIQDLGIKEATSNDINLRNTWLGNILTTITFVSRNRNLSIQKVFVVSQKDSIEPLIQLLSSRLSYPIIPTNLPEDISFKNEEDYLRMQKTGGIEFAKAVGLALLGEKDAKGTLFCDISKHVLVEKKSVGIKITTTIILLALINGVAFYFYPYINNTLMSLQTNISNTKNKIEIASKAAEQTNKLKNELSTLGGTLSQYETVKKDLKNRSITSALLAELKAKLPPGVFINSVSLNEKGDIAISGTGTNYKTVLDYEVNLSSAKYIKNATIHSMSKSSGSAATFSMSAYVKGANNEKK